MEKFLKEFSEVNEMLHGSKVFDLMETARAFAVAVYENSKEDAESALNELKDLIADLHN